MTKFLDKTGVEHLVQKTKELISDAIYVHPSSSGNKHIPSGGSSGQILRWSADGEAAWGADKDTTYSAATASAAGLMSASDKSKLDGIATGATKTAVDSALSSTSTNPVQNKVINSALAGKASTSHTHAISDITDLQKTLDGKASASHTHSYAGSASAGGSATSAVKLDSSAGSVTQPVYFSNGKPVATTYALNKTVPSNAVFTDTTYSAATTSAAGLMSASDKSKLDGIASGANNYTYTLPTATSSVLGGVKTGSNITNSSGTISITKANVTSALGYTPPTTNTTYSAATTSVAGLMSATDKSKLDGIASGAEVNQNAFSNVIVGETAIAADGKTDTLTLAGSNVTLTPDATNDKVTIGITKENVVAALGYTPPTSDTNTTYSNATTSAAGLMSASDKSKLDNITASADSVSFSRSLASGTKVGTITINGTGTDFYAPTNTDTVTTVSTTGSGNAITAISATNGAVTAIKGATFLTSETQLSKGTDATATKTLSHGSTFTAVTDTSVSGHTITDTTTTYTLPSETTLSVSTSGSGNAVTGISVSGHAITVTKGTTFPTSDTNTDTKVTQTSSSTNGNYPLLLAYSTSPTSGTASTTYYDTGMTANPSTNTITATTFSGALSGKAATATKLATARTIQTNLASTSSASFNGSANVTPGVTGTLPIANGGTGATTAAAALANLGAAASSHTHDSIVDSIDGESSFHFAEEAGLPGLSIAKITSWGTSEGTYIVGNAIGNSTLRATGVILGASELYFNASGTTGTVTLSDSVTKYVFIDIIYGNGDGRQCGVTRVYDPKNTSVVEVSNALVADNGWVATYCARYTISEATLTPLLNNRVAKALGATEDEEVATGYVYVMAIIGYR